MKEQKGFLLGLRATIYNLDDQAQFSLLYPWAAWDWGKWDVYV